MLLYNTHFCAFALIPNKFWYNFVFIFAMFAFIFNIIILVIGLVSGMLARIYDWYRNNLKASKDNPWKLVKVVTVTILVIFVWSRVSSLVSFMSDENNDYTEEDIEYLDPARVERALERQAKTDYINRELNFAADCYRKERKFLLGAYMFFMVSTDRVNFKNYIMEEYTLSLYQESPDTLEQYLNKVRWMNKSEKVEYMKRKEKESIERNKKL